MTVLSALRDRGVLMPNEGALLHLSEQLEENQWQDIHLAAADIHLRHQLAVTKPLELPMQPSDADTVMALLTADCGIYCLADRPGRQHEDPRFDVFLFTGDVIKAGPELPAGPEAFLQNLQGQAEQVSQGLAVLGVGEQDRYAYLGLQPLIWASRAVVHYGPEAVGRSTVEDAVEDILQRYLAGTGAAAT